MITVHPMQRGEGAALLSMVRALAESHNLTHTVLATPEMYEAAMFSDQPIVGTLMAEYDGVLAGCAVWHRSFSTNRATEVMYLEDLSALPEFRRRGIARALLKAVARLALEKNYPSVYWLMMDWNRGANALYASVGAEIEPGTTFCRIRDDALKALAS
jgi:GNAT superfamily N-acetyltransferase